jgi:hypothetical protein
MGDGPMDQSTDVLGIVSGAIFLRSSRVRQILLMASKRLSRMWTVRRKRTCGICGLVRKAYMSCISSFPL